MWDPPGLLGPPSLSIYYHLDQFLGNMVFHSTIIQMTARFLYHLQKNEGYSVKVLLKYLDEIKA